MKRRQILLISLVLIMGSQRVQAEKYVYPGEAPVFSIVFPDEWTVEAEEGILHALPADESIYLGLWALEDIDAFDAALETVDEIIAEIVVDFEAEETDEVEVNGIDIFYIDGFGFDEEDDEVNVSVALFSPDDETLFILLYFGTPEAEETHEESLKSIISSIKSE